jgi:hypothetical protein
MQYIRLYEPPKRMYLQYIYWKLRVENLHERMFTMYKFYRLVSKGYYRLIVAFYYKELAAEFAEFNAYDSAEFIA